MAAATPSFKSRSSSANWRSKDATPTAFQSPQSHSASPGGSNSRQAQMQAQADLYRIQQTQMALQLEAMKLQSLEMQERIMAAAVAYQPENMKRLSGAFAAQPFIVDVNAVPQSYINPTTYAQLEESPEETKAARRGALQSLQKAQNRRSGEYASPPHSVEKEEANAEMPRNNRLSFAEGIAARAMARKVSAGGVSGEMGVHHHHSSPSISSTSSGHSVILNEDHKHVTTPKGPTLVLSSPGEAFPSPTTGRSKARRFTVATKKRAASETSDESSSAPATPPDTMDSFLSSKPSDETIRRSSSMNAVLNPSAVEFQPGSSSSPPRVGSQLNVDASTRIARGVTAPGLIQQTVVVAIRQPRGPPREDQMEGKNFERRSRQRDFANVKSKLRTSWYGA